MTELSLGELSSPKVVAVRAHPREPNGRRDVRLVASFWSPILRTQLQAGNMSSGTARVRGRTNINRRQASDR